MTKTLVNKLLIGRNEWCELPKLNIPVIKAKIDTGAKTSSIHALNIRATTTKAKKHVYFDVHPLQANQHILVHCQAPVLDERYIMSSNGHKEHRYVIMTSLKLGSQTWNIELTLSDRDPLRFRMLLGREALNGHVLIDPTLSTNQKKLKKQTVLSFYDPKIKE